jgi:hypothetical protein
MRLSSRIALTLACCLALAACQTPESQSGSAGGGSASCQSSCDSGYDSCANACEQKVDNNMCPTECVDTLRSCQKRCS